jgi:hypothetical protein
MITAFSRIMARAQWQRETAINYDTLKDRLRSGWSPERALTIPARSPENVYFDPSAVEAVVGSNPKARQDLPWRPFRHQRRSDCRRGRDA